MPALINKSTNKILARNVISARGFWPRLRGLMGKKDFPLSSAFWIVPCPGGIHTFFMRFSIDVIFVDRSLQIVSVRKNVSAWKLLHPFSVSFHSVFEFKTPSLNQFQLQKGDKLYVGT